MAHSPSRKLFLGAALSVPLFGAVALAIGLADDHNVPQASENAIDARAMEMLKKINDQFTSQDSYSTRIKQSMTMRSAFGNEDSESTHSVAVSKPNKVAVTAEEDPNTGSIISNGKKLYVSVPMMRGYIETTAPDSIAGVFQEIQSQSIATGGGPVAFIAPLLAPNGYHGSLATVTGATYEGTEDIDGKTLHRVSYVMVPTLDDETREQLRDQFGGDDMTFYFKAWVEDGGSARLHKLHFDLGKMLQGLMAEMMEQMPQLRDMTYDVVMTFDNWKTGDDVSSSQFAFEAPEGATKATSMDELITASQPASPDELLGKTAPDVEVPLLDGSVFSLESHKGTDIVILDFWATWCGPCIQAMPVLMEVAESYKDRNVVLYAVNVREKNETIEQFIETRGWKLKIPLDRDGGVGAKFNVSGIPQTVIVGKDGTVQAVHVGYSPQLKQQLTSELDTLLAGEKLAE